LDRSGVGDEDLHNFDFDRGGFCGLLGGTSDFHFTIMPKSVGTVCTPDHTGLVTNCQVRVYFRRSTLVHTFLCNLLPSFFRQLWKTRPQRTLSRFHHISHSWNEPSTSVDCTLQVLLELERKNTFLQSAQTSELISCHRPEQR
jgi:hypothetical protein